MHDTTIRYSDREIINRWAVAAIDPGISRFLAGRNLVSPGADGCIGYFYVDHEEGISFRIHALCRVGSDPLPRIVAGPGEVGEGCVLRYEEIGDFRLLSFEEANDLFLMGEQRWCTYFEPERLREVRNRVDLDRFRAPAYFDDVSVILLAHDRERIPEVVWVRLESLSGDGTSFRGTLLNEPDADFGVHEGDTLTVVSKEDEEGRFLAAEIRSA